VEGPRTRAVPFEGGGLRALRRGGLWGNRAVFWAHLTYSHRCNGMVVRPVPMATVGAKSALRISVPAAFWEQFSTGKFFAQAENAEKGHFFEKNLLFFGEGAVKIGV